MKLKQIIIISVLAITGLTSCEKNLYEPTQEDPKTDIKDLVISDDFSWKMTQKVNCAVNSNDIAMVSIYGSASYSEESLLATVLVKAGNAPTLPIAIPEGTQTLYIGYEYAQNPGNVKKTTASVEDGKVQFTVPGYTTNARAVGYANKDFEKQGNTIFYPSKGGGTIMFEDNYPELGDYDFNDFVAYYNIEISTYPNASDVKSIKFSMTVRAIGATYKYIPHLRLTSYTINSLEGDIEVNKQGFDNLNVNLLSDSKPGDGGKDGKIVLAFNGAEDKSGLDYLNTKKESEVLSPKSFDVTLNFKPGCSLEYLYIDKFDIFLASADKKKEIHMLGYGPAFKSEGYANPEYYRDSKTNLVWGINIPTTAIHVYEQEKFQNAYPKFVDWITEKPGASKDWYNFGVEEYIYPMKK